MRQLAHLWHRVCAALLCLALAGPAMSAPEPAHPVNDHGASHASDPSGETGHHHDSPDIDADDHCHPGLDCFFQAVFSVQAVAEPAFLASALSGDALDSSLESMIRGFDPPPPRGLS